MKLLVFGATGGTGSRLVQQALEQGHVVTAFARDPRKIRLSHDNLRVVRGDILNKDSVEAAIAGQDGVVSALGTRPPIRIVIAIIIACQIIVRMVALSPPLNLFVELGVPILAILLLSRRTTILSEGTRNIVQAMERAGIKRFVCESSLGVGNSKWKMGVVHNLIGIPLFLRNVFADKEAQEEIIASSSLDWVIVRPAVLTNGPQRKVYRAGPDVGNWFVPSRVSRSDVADFMLKQLTSGEYLRRTPGLAD
ncbi:MAG TPA: SDR family oxidoreductase [Gemmatimonadaceae bacterium]|nr:SDR family oxidoreductase [Gemmatimonadaceae bacterium]